MGILAPNPQNDYLCTLSAVLFGVYGENSHMSTKQIPVAILVRVSTAKQENDRQITELQSYADSKGYEVVEICEEHVSGNADQLDRHGLQRIEELARSGMIKKILVHEVSRLARRNSVAHSFIETMDELGVSLYWHQQGTARNLLF